MTNLTIPDAAARLQALDISNSFCVQAPAGSGKTELLTQRILKLLAQSEKPEEVLAFTFTRKAAAEMRSRLLQSLSKANMRTKLDIAQLAAHEQLTHELATAVLKQDKLKSWHLLANTQRLKITTIDAFNGYITSQLPITSEFGAQPEISTDMEPIYQQAIQSMLSYLDDSSAISGQISTLLLHLDNNLAAVQKLLCQLLQNRDHWLGFIYAIDENQSYARELLSNNLNELIEDALDYATILLEPYRDDITKLLSFAAHNLALAGDDRLQACHFELGFPNIDAKLNQEWRALANFFLTTTGSLRKSVTIKNGFPAPSSTKDAEEKATFKAHKELFLELSLRFTQNTEIHDLFLQLQQLPSGSYDDSQWEVISALTMVLPFLVAHLDIELKNQAKVDYVKVSSSALNALGTEDSPTDLTMRLDYQIKHILVDEFQDTSSQQVKLLEKLTWGWQNDDGRTLFIVGDGMQSCYSFRNANVGLFLSARDNGIGQTTLKSLTLKVNFRSENSVVQWVNTIFSQSFPALDNISRGAVSYSQSQAIKQSSSHSGVETLLWVSPKEADISKRQQRLIEADAIVSQLDSINTTHPDSSIAILVRTRNHLSDIVPALRKAGINWNASNIDLLASYIEIMDLLTLLKALLNLGDKTAWLALLRTPYIGLALSDIHVLANHCNQQQSSFWHVLCDFETVSTLSSDAKNRLGRCIAILKKGRNKRQEKNIREWLEGTWILLGGPATLTENVELANIETFFEILDDESSHGDIIDIHHFEERLNKVYASGTQNSDIRLHIMTIHNAKGLEFDFVLIPGLERTTRSSDRPLLIWKEHLNAKGEERLLLSLLNKKGELADPNYQYLKYEAGIREQMENTRLLYIAITRAAKKVVLFAQLQSNKGNLLAPPKSALLATIWQQLENPASTISVNTTNILDELDGGLDGGLDSEFNAESSLHPADQDPHASTQTMNNVIILQRLKSTWKNPYQLTINEAESALTEKMTLPDKNPHHHLLEKTIGDIIHYCLKLKVQQNLNLLSPKTLDTLNVHWRQQLSTVCCKPEEIDNAIITIKSNINNCLRHPKADWLFDHSHTESSCELSMSDYRYNFRKEYIIDRTFVDANDIRWVVDYKSSQKPFDLDIQLFLEQQIEQYRPQLQKYASLFSEIESRPIRTALFFTSIPYWLDLSTP